MSGPKLSQAEIERLQREQMERQRQEAIQREKQRIRALERFREASAYRQRVASEVARYLEGQLTASGTSSTDAAAVEAVRRDYSVRIQRLSVSVDENDTGSIDAGRDGLLAKTDALRRAFLEAVKPELDRLNIARKAVESEALQRLSDVDFSAVGCGGDFRALELLFDMSRIDRNFETKVRGIWDRCRERETSEKVSPELKELYRRMMDTIRRYPTAQARHDGAEQLTGEIRTFCAVERAMLDEQAARAEAYDDYRALCRLLERPIQPDGDFGTAAELTAVCEALREDFRKKDEMDFVADAVNAVMRELGYQTLASSTLRRKDGTEQDRSDYQMDEDSAISVYTGEDGTVMMEVANIGDGPVTDADRRLSYEKQLDFCSQHPDIEEALRDKGVYLEQLSYASPNEKYAKKTGQAVKDSVRAAAEKKKESETGRRDRRHRNAPRQRQMS